MALLLNTEYIVVEEVSPNGVSIRFHRDTSHRARYKTGTEDKYESTRQESRAVKVDMTVMADPTKSIRDNNILAGYSALKTLEEFTNSVDC